MSKRLIVVDVSNFIFRAFFAIRPLHSPEGVPVNAVHGVLSMFLKLLSTYRPTHVLLARDTKGGSFRNELYDAYKANRSEPPEDLVPQFALIGELIDQMGLPYSMDDNYEADDIIGSACVQWKNDFDEIYIASGDKDLMQFVGDNIYMLDTMKDKLYDSEGVFEKMGVKPDQIVDYLSMVGDTSDNIPGMKGIGAKGAAKLLAEHGTLDACIEAKDTFKGKKLTTAFSEYLDDGLLSKKLIKIVTDVELGHKASDTEYKFYPSDELIEYLKGLGFKTVLKKLKDMQYQIAQTEQNDGGLSEPTVFEKKAIDTELVAISSEEQIELLKKQVKESEFFALHTEYDSEDKIMRNLIGLAFSFEEGKAYFLDLRNNKNKELSLELLKMSWGDETKKIQTEHGKRDYTYALVNNLPFNARVFDVVQVHYNINTGGNHSIESLAQSIGEEVPPMDKKNPFITELDDESALQFAGLRAAVIFNLSASYKEDLKKHALEEIYYNVDAKLISVLASMEKEGVLINPAYFSKFEKELTEKIDSIQAKINKYSENEVNLNSPKQVGEFLFNELALPVVKKTKTGFSTDSEVLEDLASRNISEVPSLILQYREIGKILSTYVKAIPQLVNEKDKKIHTSFNQHIAQTGRLSSVNPNLQNIPIRSETGRLVRKGFIASPGNLLLAADYSQVELRLLAHFSEDPTMLKAFNDGIDIHTQTASEIMGVSVDEVTSNDRSKAKAVNFGLMYGQSSFGLAKALKISRRDAKEYIDRYFERFNKVKSYLDSLKEEAEVKGYSITLNGRKRFLPDIMSSNRNIKANAERMAINSPIQGTAADIIKIAMINIQKTLEEKELKSKMILQVHDELIFDVPENELEQMKAIVREGMEKVVNLRVPLSVDMGYGVNWFDLK
ncbi:DNA polymerase I [Halobacteriovorax sp. GB3]|uniref:DNA polymerase I n=1 Tax=Halobacteriovorax sp. GB3 TaxID=2719615 RepID=UPI00235EA216|nr:DNA polymerase I [Halobacteriovorax sp. GB3]MDD0852435.1 DNA polymerase I [Halobacteriovorax sp. GB3]